jgi:hypothetical protein
LMSATCGEIVKSPVSVPACAEAGTHSAKSAVTLTIKDFPAS